MTKDLQKQTLEKRFYVWYKFKNREAVQLELNFDTTSNSYSDEGWIGPFHFFDRDEESLKEHLYNNSKGDRDFKVLRSYDN